MRRTVRKGKAEKESSEARKSRHEETHKAIGRAAKKLVIKQGSEARKLIAKESRAPSSGTAKEEIIYGALLEPTVIVPDDAEEKALIADAGSIVKRAEQTVFYRDRVSPITRNADEVLVHYGKSNKVKLGWLAVGTKLKSVKGPTFLVQTRDSNTVKGWDAMRLLISNARAKYSNVAEWLAANREVQRPLIREVIRQFGGKVLKSHDNDTRVKNLLSLILHTEIEEMPATKKVTKKVPKSSKKEAATKVVKKAKKSKADSNGTERVGHAIDGHIIKRLTEGGKSPFREGSAKEKEWRAIKKGMTVGELVEKGGRRGNVNFYVRKGWVKLLRPKKEAASGDE